MNSRVFAAALCVLILTPVIIFSGGSIPAGLPNTFGFGCIDKADSYATSTPHFWKDGQYSPCSGWDYSYQYLTPGWVGWVAGGAWAKQELQYWEGKGQIQVFTFYYTPYTLSNYQTPSWMNTYFSDFKTLMQVINANSSKVVIVHIEPDFLGYMRQKGAGAYNQSGLVSVGGSGFSETDDGVAISSLPNTLQGWSEALFRIRNQYARNKVILAHHFTHWATGTDLFVNTHDQTTCNTNVDDMCNFIKNVENGHAYDLFFVDPSDRDADWYRINGGGSNTRWTGPTRTYTQDRNWGKISYITDRISTNLARRGFMWQIPAGNTYYKTCNNSANHYRDNSAQEFLPSTSSNGSSGTPGDAYSSSSTTTGPGYWAQYGIIGVLFGEGGYDQYANPNNMTHLRDWPNDGTTNPGSDSNAGGPSYDVWGQATSNVSDNDGGYIRNAVLKYCQTGKYIIGGPAATITNTPLPTKTNTPVPPTSTDTPIPPTKTNTPLPTSSSTPLPTYTYTATKTQTPAITNTSTQLPTLTFTPTNIAPTATPTYTRIATVAVPSNTPTQASTASASPTSPAPGSTNTFTPTFTRTSTTQPTRTFTAIIPTATFTRTPTLAAATATPTSQPPGVTSTFTRTVTPVLPTMTFTPTHANPTATPTPQPPGLTPTFTATYPAAGELTFTSYTLVPNPLTESNLELSFTAKKASNRATVRIYTRSFRLIRKVDFSGIYAADVPFILTVQHKYLMGLSRGIYFCTLEISDNSKSKTTPVMTLFIAQEQ